MRLTKPLIVMTAAASFVAVQGCWALTQAPSVNPEQTSPAPDATSQPVAVGNAATPGSDVPAASTRKTYTVPAGTKVLLQLRSSVNTKSARPGDGVYLSSTFPVVVGNRVLIPACVFVQGVVDRVARAGHVKGKAQLDMHFTSMIFPNGSVVEIPGVVNGLPGASKQQVKKAREPSNKIRTKHVMQARPRKSPCPPAELSALSLASVRVMRLPADSEVWEPVSPQSASYRSSREAPT